MPGQLRTSETRVIQCNHPVRGRYVTVNLNQLNPLTICEFEVHGTPAGNHSFFVFRNKYRLYVMKNCCVPWALKWLFLPQLPGTWHLTNLPGRAPSTPTNMTTDYRTKQWMEMLPATTSRISRARTQRMILFRGGQWTWRDNSWWKKW